MDDATPMDRDVQRRMYTAYLTCCSQAHQAILESEAYQRKLTAAKGQHKAKYRSQDLEWLQESVRAQVNKACSDSRLPVLDVVNQSCSAALERYLEAFQAFGDLHHKPKEDPVRFEEILDAKVSTSTARMEFDQCRNKFVEQLRSELQNTETGQTDYLL